MAYPRAPVDDRSHSVDNEDMMELDFADTSALSDPNVFQEKDQAVKNEKGKGRKENKKKGKKERAEDKEEIERSWDVPEQAPPAPPLPVTNGKSNTPVKASTLPVANGPKPSVDPGLVKISVISTLSSQNAKLAGMPRNEFVREVLTLIHTDKNFVDNLWREYMLRSG